VKCLDGVKGKLQSTSGQRGICPSCNTDSLYIGEDTYDNLLNFAQPHLAQNEGVAISAHGASNYEPGSKENPFTIEGGGSKKKKKKVVKTIKRKLKNKRRNKRTNKRSNRKY
jgi:hypothetical protein